MQKSSTLERTQTIAKHLQQPTSKMSLAPVTTNVQAAGPVPVDNELKGRLTLVTGASGG